MVVKEINWSIIPNYQFSPNYWTELILKNVKATPGQLKSEQNAKGFNFPKPTTLRKITALMDKWRSAVISGDNINVHRESEWYFSVTENVLVIGETERERCVSFYNGFIVLASIEVEIVNIDT